jgi:glyoxylase-like metal-dependent hydrolase (beta-lactamase superfamily II)
MASAIPSPQPVVHPVFEPVTGTFQYVVADPSSKDAVIIDPVLDFDLGSSKISTTSADQVLQTVHENGYTVTHVLETHAHADHLTASRYVQQTLAQSGQNPPLIAIGQRIKEVQKTFAAMYGIPSAELDSAFDKLLQDDEEFAIGTLEATAIHLPGHTPDSVGYVIGNNVFVGDSLFNPDVGSARCDFPGGSATTLYSSIQRLLSLPEHYRLYTGHDYPPAGRGPEPFYPISEQKATNKHAVLGESEFIEWRSQRDSGLSDPRLLHQALQVNTRGGRIPVQNDGGTSFFKVPVKGPETVLGML